MFEEVTDKKNHSTATNSLALTLVHVLTFTCVDSGNG